MGIDLTWIDENGSLLDSAGDPDFHFAGLVDGLRNDRETGLRLTKSIDPYGVTRFAPPQLTTLLRELESLRDQVSNPEVSITLGHYLSIVRAAEGAPGTWIEFEGD